MMEGSSVSGSAPLTKIKSARFRPGPAAEGRKQKKESEETQDHRWQMKLGFRLLQIRSRGQRTQPQGHTLEKLSDLDCVERRSLEELVTANPEGEAILKRGVNPQPPNRADIFAGIIERHRIDVVGRVIT